MDTNVEKPYALFLKKGMRKLFIVVIKKVNNLREN